MKIQKIITLVILVLLIAGLATACGGDETATEETGDATTPEATDSPTEEVVSDSMWSQIQSSGVMTVGTSSGYPPFEYIDTQTYQLDGFDIALMNDYIRMSLKS